MAGCGGDAVGRNFRTHAIGVTVTLDGDAAVDRLRQLAVGVAGDEGDDVRAGHAGGDGVPGRVRTARAHRREVVRRRGGAARGPVLRQPGRLVCESVPYHSPSPEKASHTRYEYDDRDRLIKATRPDGGLSQVSYAANATDHEVTATATATATAPDGTTAATRKTERVYDVLGQLQSTTEGGGTVRRGRSGDDDLRLRRRGSAGDGDGGRPDDDVRPRRRRQPGERRQPGPGLGGVVVSHFISSSLVGIHRPRFSRCITTGGRGHVVWAASRQAATRLLRYAPALRVTRSRPHDESLRWPKASFRPCAVRDHQPVACRVIPSAGGRLNSRDS